MDLLSAIAGALRVMIMVLGLSVVIGFRREIWRLLTRQQGWKPHLTTGIFALFVTSGLVGSVVQVFPDLDLHIPEHIRLAVVCVSLAMFLVATLTGFYRRAMRAGPEKARAALLSGLALIVPFAGLVTLLALRGANG